MPSVQKSIERTKFKNKYRIESTRIQNWDYGNSGAYFVTMCTKNREHYFGEIVEGEMLLSEIGKIAEIEWIKTIELRPDMNLELGAYVVMPNHFHAVIIIGDNEYNTQVANGMAVNDKYEISCTPTMYIDATQSINKFGPQSKNLAAIIRGFKSSITTHARKTNVNFAWQSLFHEHIIRNSISFERIQNYIFNNPKKWKEDKFHLKE